MDDVGLKLAPATGLEPVRTAVKGQTLDALHSRARCKNRVLDGDRTRDDPLHKRGLLPLSYEHHR